MILNLYIVFMLIRSFVVFDLDSITTLLVFQLLYGRTVKLIVDIERVYVWSGGVDLGIV